MFRNQPRLIGYLAPIALVAFLSAPQILAQTPTRTVAVANAPLSLSLTSDANIVSDFEIVVKLLCAKGVEFVVIGGQAETMLGSPRVTFDTDLCHRKTEQNLKRLADPPRCPA